MGLSSLLQLYPLNSQIQKFMDSMIAFSLNCFSILNAIICYLLGKVDFLISNEKNDKWIMMLWFLVQGSLFYIVS